RPTSAGYALEVPPVENQPGACLYFTCRGATEPTVVRISQASYHDNQEIGHQVLLSAVSRIYAFRAERLNVHRHPMGTAVELNPDASNLPEVLDNLQSNPARYERYNEAVRRVFPQIFRVCVVSVGANLKEIRVWMASTDTERTDLAFPLSDCGTGIGQ